MLITIVAGARPNFMKIAPIIRAIEAALANGHDIHYRLVHTGQHYDKNLSKTFFDDLNIPHPHVNLEAGSGSQAVQTAAIMVAFEKELIKNPTDLVMVAGDVNSTLACSITAKKLNIPVAHVEAGIRSGDRSMPEEINRIVTDSLSDLFFTTSITAGENLKKTGIPGEKIHFTGNVMIDTLLSNFDRLRKPAVWDQLGLAEKNYLILTLHRPANVDDPANLKKLLDEISKTATPYKTVFPVHPRTREIIKRPGITHTNIHYCEPMGYLEFNFLVRYALGVITDSGGITEETTVLGVPCITLRNSTERPETCTIGTNELIGTDPSVLAPWIRKMISGNWKKGGIPEKWDGKAAERIVEVLLKLHPEQ
jgi:UDP-N-acetylglucosamine 2-epimerase (non-hydrolysing)